MNCCAQCFETKFLIEQIEKTGQSGSCDCCGSENVKVVAAHDLGGYFDGLVDLYEPADDGNHMFVTSLAECLEEWEIFSERLDTDQQNALLDEIRFGDLRYKRRFEHHLSSDGWASEDDSLFSTDSEELWNEFALHIKHKRRFLPKAEEFEFLANPNDWLPEMLDATELRIDSNTTFFRARIGCVNDPSGGDKPFPATEMGALSKEKARRNRANPAGISYLYVAEQEQTAVAEIRAFVGAKVSICRVNPLKELVVADLTRIHGIANPFVHETLSWLVKRNRMLNMLNEVLARPVNPEDNEIEYVPTQYLAEVILNAGYDGIRYKSAIAESGSNFVFFRPPDLQIHLDTTLVEVTTIETAYRNL